MADERQRTLDDLRALLEDDPGNDAFVELASRLSGTPEGRREGREICFQGLTHSPQALRGRLLLAKLFYLDQMPEFCVRELLELRKRSDAPSLARLLDSFGDVVKALSSQPKEYSSPVMQRESVVGAMDFESDFVDALEELEEEEEEKKEKE